MRILIISISGMGTTIMFLPLLKHIKKKFPDASVELLVGKPYIKDLLSENEFIDQIHVWDFFSKPKSKTIRFLLSLRKNKYDFSFSVYPNLRREHNVIAFLIGAKKRIIHKLQDGKIGRLSLLNHGSMEPSLLKHDIENNSQLLQDMGIMIKTTKEEFPEIVLKEEEKAEAEEFFKNNQISQKKVVGIRVGEQFYSQGRNWPLGKFVNLIHMLHKEGIEIVVFSTQDEQKTIDALKEKISSKIIIFENNNIRKVAATIEKCSCFLVDDSGLMHIASSVKTPIVALFGPTNKNWTSPLSNSYKIIESGIDCSPCLNRINTPKGRDLLKFNLINCYIEEKFACMKEIEEKFVFDVIKNVIK